MGEGLTATSEPVVGTNVPCTQGKAQWWPEVLQTETGKSGLTKNKTIDAIVACKGREDLRPMEEYGYVGN